MKKFFFVLAAAFAVLASCKKQSELNFSDISKKYTVVGTVTYKPGVVVRTNGGFAYDTAFAASGVTVVAQIPYAQFKKDARMLYDDPIIVDGDDADEEEGGMVTESYYSVEATTDADGKFTIEIPTGDYSSVGARITIKPFYREKGKVVNGKVVKKEVLYTSKGSEISIGGGNGVVYDFAQVKDLNVESDEWDEEI